MEFQEKKAIYLQIAAWLSDQIVQQVYPPGGRLISIRELAAELAVNPNTVQRSYEYLQQQGIIYTQRGLGYFVADDAPQRILAARRAEFCSQELPDFIKTMQLLNISLEDFIALYHQLKNR